MIGYWLRKLLHTESSVSSDDTYRYKLPVTGLYSAFEVQLYATRYSTRDHLTTPDWLRNAITKIEMLSEGTKVIKSLRGAELNALNTFDFGQIPRFKHGEYAAETNFDNLYLLAGRGLQDKEYMFDMSKFSDPEIALTNAIREDAARGFTDESLQYKIYGWRWMGDPIPMPKGYMRADERLYYTTTADGTIKPLQITTGKRIRRILVKGWQERASIAAHFDRLELEVDEGAFSPIVVDSMMEWALQNKLDYKLDLRQCIAQYIYERRSTHQTDAFIPYHSSAVCTPVPCTENQVGSVSIGNGVIDGVISEDDAGAITAGWLEVWCDGAGYQRAVLLGFDKEPDLADMLETRDMGILKLLITEQTAAYIVSVVVEEEVLY